MGCDLHSLEDLWSRLLDFSWDRSRSYGGLELAVSV